VYVTDRDNNRIQKFDSTGKFITTWGSHGSDDGQFKSPTGIAVDSSGNAYITDYNNRVQKFDNFGKFITTWPAMDNSFIHQVLLSILLEKYL
jgi:tripartite motif-containing protein 71